MYVCMCIYIYIYIHVYYIYMYIIYTYKNNKHPQQKHPETSFKIHQDLKESRKIHVLHVKIMRQSQSNDEKTRVNPN